ncbi:hypothetical protein MTsPCn9_06350 [Croceitalea sp. MTPC9]|uniref:hypothetical protein n=1 Tax=unclassified Croceitalea TaxID=2632280 RepID=UPI002B3AA67E|nr:hypothetical protein MTsPCn6_02360 [Croceitalea sp. MTPC6]GMN15699.1 hypothetical protein MTsPCn9_06350 [Croceitalea sp. MTPC9]
MKKRILIPYLLLATAVVISIGLFFRLNVLQNRVNKFDADEEKLTKKVSIYEDLFSKDSLLLTDDYNTALREYDKIAHEIGSENNGLKLRIALAKKIRNYNEQRLRDKTNQAEDDSLALPKLASPIEIQRYDSLSFAHEKAKIQLNRLRKQLQEKSFGEYLTFKSKKGNQMHYVGQVRNNMANGYGIALLDTGSRYEGEWKDNQRHGQGAFYWPDGEYYVGGYVNAKRTGYGTYYWPNGEKYVGNWKDDKRNGEGEFYAKDGSVLTSGTWQDDKLVETDKKEKKTRR